MNRIFIGIISWCLFFSPLLVHGATLKADFRPRHPEMVVSGEEFSGPLKEIIEEAAAHIGHRIEWALVPFPRSLQGLKMGHTDIVPRTIKNQERLEYVAYLGPIGYQQKDILFIVGKDREKLVTRYEDLYSHVVGSKRDTAYFEEFDHDMKIKKMPTLDDENLAKMFAVNRFDVIIVLDKPAIEKAFRDIGFSDYAYAEYRHAQRIGNYYGMSKKSKFIEIYPRLNAVLQDMAASGRVTEIYKQYGIRPPLQ